MKINDTVYGEYDITEPVLIELINSKPVQRIKNVNQAGTQLVQTNKTVTRYDHCVGAALLLRNFGASLEEQIAGLLHDVPHTAFSHAVDFVFNEGDSQEYHERFLKKIVFDSEIPAILKRYGIDPHFVTDETNFSLLEQPIPQLCADRIDYSLRDMQNDKVFTQKDITRILHSLSAFNGLFVITNKKDALFYARTFMNQCLDSWNAPRTLAVFEIFGQLIRAALKKKIISETDLFTTDEELIAKLAKSGDKKVKEILAQLTPEFAIEFNEIDYDFDTRGKVRYIDPPVKVGGTVKPLSSLVPEFSNEINEFIAKTKKGYRVKLSQT